MRSTGGRSENNKPLEGDYQRQALFSIPEARRYVGGIGNTKAYELISQGHWSAVKMGGRTFVTAESLERFVQALPPAEIHIGSRNDQGRALKDAA